MERNKESFGDQQRGDSRGDTADYLSYKLIFLLLNKEAGWRDDFILNQRPRFVAYKLESIKQSFAMQKKALDKSTNRMRNKIPQYPNTPMPMYEEEGKKKRADRSFIKAVTDFESRVNKMFDGKVVDPWKSVPVKEGG